MKEGPFDSTSVRRPSAQQADFDEFEATELYCTTCGGAVPVRKFLLLVLPEGDKYEYRCAVCGNTVGDKMDRSADPFSILKSTQ